MSRIVILRSTKRGDAQKAETDGGKRNENDAQIQPSASKREKWQNMRPRPLGYEVLEYFLPGLELFSSSNIGRVEGPTYNLKRVQSV